MYKLPREPALDLLLSWASAGQGRGARAVTPRLSCPSQHGARRCCRRLSLQESTAWLLLLPARRVRGHTGAPLSSHRPRAFSAPAAPCLAPPQAPGSLCLQPDATAGVKPERPGALQAWGHPAPGPWWTPPPLWRKPALPCAPRFAARIAEQLPSARSPGGAVS